MATVISHYKVSIRSKDQINCIIMYWILLSEKNSPNIKAVYFGGQTGGGKEVLRVPAPAGDSNPVGPYPNLFHNPVGHTAWGCILTPFLNPMGQI